jgi:hypothetical protein
MRMLLKVMIAALGFGLSSGANANLITNGSFENGPTTFGVAPDNWVVAGNAGYGTTTFDALFTPPDGARSVTLGYDNTGVTGGTISQSFATLVGVGYDVSFHLAVNGDPVPPFSMIAEAFGLSGALNSIAITQSSPPSYQLYGFSFVADALTTTLSFTDVSVTSYRLDGHLDNVIVAQVPQPATLSLLGLGVFSLCWVRRQAQQSLPG